MIESILSSIAAKGLELLVGLVVTGIISLIGYVAYKKNMSKAKKAEDKLKSKDREKAKEGAKDLEDIINRK